MSVEPISVVRIPDWDWIEDRHLSLSFPNSSCDLYDAIYLHVNEIIIITFSISFLRTPSYTWQFYYFCNEFRKPVKEVSLTLHEKQSKFFMTLKERILRLFPEIML